ncbi:TlyA family RNA methyltransferase [Zafaria sp. Z1313]|uniref:TlyA family RNA methyltransferase n=1 Tax=unclassified Zafaria TaxID=2828765 RepID=UPI002E7A2DCE|nr:TlyA family RNA methyltransferase [Zafaria sp. J156]MEE1622533.1 TlyA family RNA methyltransferase [Zafaria sp. J156]
MARLDAELVARGLARSRTQAAALVAGGRVLLDGAPAAKASRPVAEGQRLEVLPAEGAEYVSRAGHKLAGALDAFDDVVVRGRRCLDAGASTGGFTQVLLLRGAASVAAVDVGHGQLVDELRRDPRVDVREGYNVRHLEAADLGGPVDLVVADLSFISLTLVMAPLAAATRPGGDLVLMVKPQFEVGRENLSRTGVVTDPGWRRRAVEAVIDSARSAGLALRGLARSPLPGQDGNAEFFLRLRVPDPGGPPQPDAFPAVLDEVDYS